MCGNVAVVIEVLLAVVVVDQHDRASVRKKANVGC